MGVSYEPTKQEKTSEYYVDIKRSYGEQAFLREYASYILFSIGFNTGSFFCVAGSGHGGIPLATEIFSHLKLYNIKLSLVRDIPKKHGKPTMFDGYPLEELNMNKEILIVDDVFTTGSSIKKIIELLPEGQKFKIFVVCNRSGIERPEINGVEVKYIFTPEELKSV